MTPRPMLDFTSALYLGLDHDHASLGPWSRLSAGVPAALAEPDGAPELASRMAAWIGTERATLATSTLHLFWDLFGVVTDVPSAIYWDAGMYPVARWGVERALLRSTPASRFDHHDPDALLRALRREHTWRRPVVVTDGYCPGCGRPAPLGDYLAITRSFGGCLVLDDTQCLGLLGDPSVGSPYGTGGGGSLRQLGLTGPDLVVAASLAKAFGAPITVLAASREVVARFERESDTRVHCSPPSVPAVRAAASALSINALRGERLRVRLARNLRRFAMKLRATGHRSVGGLHPVQRVATVSAAEAPAVHQRLMRAGMRVVLQRPSCVGGAAVTFVVTARHSEEEIDEGVARFAEAARLASRGCDAPDNTTPRRTIQ